MVFEKEFKEAILDLPEKEKDKLLLRLLKKDVPLANQLYFELVSTQTVEERRAELEELVRKRAESILARSSSVQHLQMLTRSLSGDITVQTKITKDKFGEISLNLLMLNEILKTNKLRSELFYKPKAMKFAVYVVARTFKLLVLIRAMHEDYLSDFKSDLETLGERIAGNELLMRTAIQHGLDVNWLLSGEIPEDIKHQQDVLKKQGFLK